MDLFKKRRSIPAIQPQPLSIILFTGRSLW